jgi:hypothetical protein
LVRIEVVGGGLSPEPVTESVMAERTRLGKNG